MGRSCCVTNCSSNYDDNNYVPCYRLPKDPKLLEVWLKAIPRDNTPVTKNTVVCIKHWPPNFPTYSCYGKLRPAEPPSIFENIPKSQIPTPPAMPRSTEKATAESRAVDIDEMIEFDKSDILTFENMCKEIDTQRFSSATTSYKQGDCLCIQSVNCLPDVGIPLFLIKIFPNQSFHCFHVGIKTTIEPLKTLKVYRVSRWCQIEVMINYLKNLELDRKKTVLHEQCVNMNVKAVGTLKYSKETIMRAFEYFACSRALYNRLREDYQLPSVSTLTRLSSKVNNSTDRDYIHHFFSKLDGKNKNYVLLIDEVYIKALLTYHGGELFGKALNNPEALATTVLGFMLVPCFEGPSFLIKMMPVNRLDATFLYTEAQALLINIRNAGGVICSIICDNNRVNQCFFSMMADPATPWKTHNNMFLLYDYVHLLKSIRNNWLSEKVGEIQFPHENTTLVAKWDHLRKLQKMEEGPLVKMSRLNYTAVNPKPIERQKVDTCLRVFCDETIQALKEVDLGEDASGTINMFVKFWKMLNVKSQYEDVRLKDPRRAAFTSDTDPRLEFLTELAALSESLRGGRGTRVKMLTCDTSKALSQTCRGIVELVKFLLNTTHEYVLLGKFNSDPIEKEFGKLRQGSGGTYFINAQQVLEKVNKDLYHRNFSFYSNIQCFFFIPGNSGSSVNRALHGLGF